MLKNGLIKRFYIAVVFLIGCCTFIIVYFQDREKNDPIPAPKYQIKEYQRTQIHGFHSTGFDGEKKIFSIKGDSLSVEKMKMGFLRTSLLNEAIIKNGIFDLYSNSVLNGSDGSPARGDSFTDAFWNEKLSSINGIKVSSIKVSPVTISLYQNDILVTRIKSQSAKVRIIQRDIFFSGKVIVESGASKLTTESLIFKPDDATIQTDIAYELICSKGNIKGKGFNSDIFLKLKSTKYGSKNYNAQ